MKMNLTSALEKVVIILFSIFWSTITITSVDAERSLRIVKSKPSLPFHVHVRSDYGRPPYNPNFQGKNPKNVDRWNRKFGPKNYANEFRNWMPNNFRYGKYNPRVDRGKYNPRIDKGKRGTQRPFHAHYFRDPSYKNKIQPGKSRLGGMSHLQKPQPPKFLFSDEYYFPEETLKLDGQNDFDFDHLKSKKKRRNPNGVEKIPKRSEYKGTYFESGKPKKSSKPKVRNPSYGAFVRWPSLEDEYDGDEDFPEYSRQTTKTKRKKIKKKSHSKKISDPEFNFSYQYDHDDEFDGSDKFEKKSKKRIKKQPHESKEDDENQYQIIKGLSAVKDHYNNNPFEKAQIQNLQGTSHFSPPNQQTWSQIVGTTPRTQVHNVVSNPVTFQSQQFVPNQFGEPIQSQQNQFNQQSFVQKPQIITSNNQLQSTTHYSQPHNYYNKNNIFSEISSSSSSSNQQTTDKSPIYGVHNRYTNAYTSPQTSNFFSDNNQNYVGQYTVSNSQNYNTQYTSNNNHQSSNTVKNQNLSHLENNQSYGTRVSSSYQAGSSDAEIDFLKKHQSLYHKGLSGVPIQGDGYHKNSGKGDYDIGYGDFQFDENTST